MYQEKFIQNKIAEEVSLIPGKNQQELYELIRDFRTSLNSKENKDQSQEICSAESIMEFAGSWADFPNEDFEDFCEEISQRRQASVSRRFEF